MKRSEDDEGSEDDERSKPACEMNYKRDPFPCEKT